MPECLCLDRHIVGGAGGQQPHPLVVSQLPEAAAAHGAGLEAGLIDCGGGVASVDDECELAGVDSSEPGRELAAGDAVIQQLLVDLVNGVWPGRADVGGHKVVDAPGVGVAVAGREHDQQVVWRGCRQLVEAWDRGGGLRVGGAAGEAGQHRTQVSLGGRCLTGLRRTVR